MPNENALYCTQLSYAQQHCFKSHKSCNEQHYLSSHSYLMTVSMTEWIIKLLQKPNY